MDKEREITFSSPRERIAKILLLKEKDDTYLPSNRWIFRSRTHCLPQDQEQHQNALGFMQALREKKEGAQDGMNKLTPCLHSHLQHSLSPFWPTGLRTFLTTSHTPSRSTPLTYNPNTDSCPDVLVPAVVSQHLHKAVSPNTGPTAEQVT